MPAATEIDLNTLLPWSAPKRVSTKNGERDLCVAAPDDRFWDLWRNHKYDLKKAGIGLGRNNRSGEWEATWWKPIAAEEAQAKTEARAQSRASDANVDLPRPVGLDYLAYQRAGILYGVDRANVLIADEMGLGKTIQGIGIANADPLVTSVLIICPASLKINWQREWQKWDVKGLTVGIANGAFPSTQVVIVNYDILKKHRAAIDARHWDMMIADEVHYCKNPKAQRTALVFGGKDIQPITADRRVFLTGTPIVNRPVEMWTLIQALDPQGIGSHFFRFAMRYCAAKQKRAGNKMVWDFSGASNLPELQDKLRERFMVRRLKCDVLTDLPPKTRQIIALPVPPEFQHLVSSEREDFDAFEDAMENLRADIDLAEAAGDEVARTIAADALKAAAKTAFTEMSGKRHEVAMAKVPAVIGHVTDLLESTPKVLVFAHHIDVIDALMDGLALFNPVKVTGSCSMDQRQAAVDALQKDPNCRVFIGNIKAAGVGLTLTEANTVVFAELDWTPAAMSQAEDRAHRIGQRDNVLVQHLVFDGSLDSVIAKKLVAKQNIIDRALDTETERAAQPEAVDSITIFEEPEGDQVELDPKTGKLRAKAADLFTAEESALIHSGLRHLAALDPDHAREENGVGFNGRDGRIGHSLANAPILTQKQAALGLRLVRRYRRQLSLMISFDDNGRPIAA
jgi:SWI/SNF-related matrix-associated actin-dependent regulator 1 of chromatin subfamily A